MTCCWCILYNNKLYVGCLRLLRCLDVEGNPGMWASHRSYRVVYANIRGLHKNSSDLSLTARGRDVVFVLRLLSLSDATFPNS